MASVTSTYNRVHARQVNARYQNTQANYVSWKQRWNEALQLLPVAARLQVNARLKVALNRFKRRYPGIKNFQDKEFRLCKALDKKLVDILIDTTIQRNLDVNWVIKIVEDFVSYQAQALQVYRPPQQHLPNEYNTADTWACWEGQHTGTALWLIGTMVFDMKENDIVVPTAEYDFGNRAECRKTFMANNSSDGRKSLDLFEIINQKICAVLLDGAKNPEWEVLVEKHRHLAAADLFLARAKSHEDSIPGAITRADYFSKEEYSVEVVRKFTVYAQEVLATNPRAIDTKELPLIFGFLKMAEQSNIEYTDDDIRSLARLCMNLFDADFSENGAFWNQVGKAYTHWHTEYYRDMDESSRPGLKLNKDWPQGGTFMWHQLKKSWLDDQDKPMPMPKLNISTPFRPSREDLW